jgi:hypothetical protein
MNTVSKITVIAMLAAFFLVMASPQIAAFTAWLYDRIFKARERLRARLMEFEKEVAENEKKKED